jgi:hypothetical protein
VVVEQIFEHVSSLLDAAQASTRQVRADPAGIAPRRTSTSAGDQTAINTIRAADGDVIPSG